MCRTRRLIQYVRYTLVPRWVLGLFWNEWLTWNLSFAYILSSLFPLHVLATELNWVFCRWLDLNVNIHFRKKRDQWAVWYGHWYSNGQCSFHALYWYNVFPPAVRFCLCQNKLYKILFNVLLSNYDNIYGCSRLRHVLRDLTQSSTANYFATFAEKYIQYISCVLEVDFSPFLKAHNPIVLDGSFCPHYPKLSLSIFIIN